MNNYFKHLTFEDDSWRPLKNEAKKKIALGMFVAGG